MDAQKELEKWKIEFRNAKTPEEKADHQKRFRAFLATLNEEEGKAFGQAFAQGSREAVATAKEIIKEINLKKKLEEIQDVISFSYIAEHYFGKTRQWLYQRINGSLVNGRPAKFSKDELKKLSQALDDISSKLQHTSASIV